MKVTAVGAASPPAASVPGTAVRWMNSVPPSLVWTMVPSVSRIHPVLGSTNQKSRSSSLHADSTLVNAIRRKLWPPSSDRRTTQPPPAITVCGESACTTPRPWNAPTRSPADVRPPSAVFRSVPKSPAAYRSDPRSQR